MVRKISFPLLFSVLCSGAAFSAPLSFSGACFDGAPGCPSTTLASVAIPAAPAPQPAQKAVVISIVGVNFTKIGFGKLESARINEITEHFNPGARQNENLFSSDLNGIEEAAWTSGQETKYPDDYLDSNLAKILPREEYEIVPVRWSRDPEDSVAAVLLVENAIKTVFAEARAEGRPVYVVAHSWGTVLAHTALNRLAASNPEVRIDKLITMGSPLVPGYWWLNIFMKHEITCGQLQSYVAKPANTAYWLNVWARSDLFSNLIAAADRNLLEDDWTAPVEAQVKLSAEADHSLRDAALLDLFFLKNPKTWHFAYVFDFQAFMRTLQKSYEKRILAPVISGELLRGEKIADY